MGNQFVFSIIMPIYNTEDYIRESIDSVLSQTLDFSRNVQLILVNDGSTDSSLDIALEYQRKYPDNIDVVSQENQGLGAARNTGLDYARGKYVNFLDPDDYFSENVLKEVKEFFEKNGDTMDIVSIRVMMFGRKTGDHPLNFKFKEDRVIDLRREPANPQLAVNSSFIRLEAFDDLRFRTDLVTSEDTNVSCKILLDKKAFGVLESPAYYYRKREDQSSLVDTAISKKAFFTYRLKNHFMDVIGYCLDREGEVPLFIQCTLAYNIQWMVTHKMPEFFTDEEKEEFMFWFKKVMSFISPEALSYKNIVFNDFLRNYLIIKSNDELDCVVDLKDNNVIMKTKDRLLDRLSNHKVCIVDAEKCDDVVMLSASFNSMFDSNNISFKAIFMGDDGNVHTAVSRPSAKHSRDNIEFFSETLKHNISFDLELPKTAENIKIAIEYAGDEGIVTLYPPVGFTGAAKEYEYIVG